MEYCKARNQFSENIKKAKEEHWKDWMESLLLAEVWSFHCYVVDNLVDQVHTCIKTLQDPAAAPNTTTQDNKRKSELLYKVFFRPPPANDFVDPDYIYPPPVCDFTPITDQQIHRGIKRLSPHKALSLNGVSNIVFMKSADLLVPFMGPIFRATFKLGIYPKSWKTSSTIVLCKPGRPDYSIPEAY